MSEPVIVLDQLAKSFGETVAVDGISMSIPAGEIFGFLGANGAGKTTTIRMLCGLTKPTSGPGSIAGRDIWKERYEIRSKFGYVAQKFSLYPDLTVLENLRFFGAAYRVSGKRLDERIETLLDQLDLRGKRHALAGSLSGGMRQMLALACALVHRARAALPRRADVRPRPGASPADLGSALRTEQPRHDDLRDHALHG